MSDTTDTLTANEWLTRYGVTFDWTADGYHADPDGWEHQRFTLTLSTDDCAVEIPWRQGLGVEDEPTPKSTLWAIASDVRAGEMDWPDFADEYGYDEHDAPLSQYRQWEACKRLAEDVEGFCRDGQMFADFLTIADDEDYHAPGEDD